MERPRFIKLLFQYTLCLQGAFLYIKLCLAAQNKRCGSLVGLSSQGSEVRFSYRTKTVTVFLKDTSRNKREKRSPLVDGRCLSSFLHLGQIAKCS